MVRINGLFHLLINGVNWGYNPLILTIDPITSNGTSGCDISSDSNRFVFGGGIQVQMERPPFGSKVERRPGEKKSIWSN